MSNVAGNVVKDRQTGAHPPVHARRTLIIDYFSLPHTRTLRTAIIKVPRTGAMLRGAPAPANTLVIEFTGCACGGRATCVPVPTRTHAHTTRAQSEAKF